MYDVLKIKDYAKQLNDITFTDYYYRLMLIARSVFEWKNLPKGISEKWIEKYLFTDGQCVFYEDDNLGLMVAKMTPNGAVNHYDEPTTVRPYATNYQFKAESLINNENCIVIKNNDEATPTAPTIQLYAYKLSNIDRTIDVNVQAQKMPIIIKCSEKQKQSLKLVISKRNDNEPVIFGDKNLETEGIEALKTEAPMVFKDLQLHKHMIWNECMSFLGLNNANQDKKERLVSDEVEANNEQIEASFNTMLRARQEAAKKINEMFGTNITVEKRIKPIVAPDDSKPTSEPSGDSKGGKIA